MVTIDFMEKLLLLASEAESLVAWKDRSNERVWKEELSKIIEEAEFWFGPRDRSYELLEPRVSQSFYATPAIYPFRKIRIFLTKEAKRERYCAAYELAHEAVHVLSPVLMLRPTLLEEGLATYFSFKYVNRNYGIQYETTGDRHYDAAFRAVSRLMAKNEFVIKEMRVRQPVISRIDVKLLVEVAGIDLDLANFLCTDFLNYRQAPMSFSQTAQVFLDGARSLWDHWSSETKA